MEVLREDVEKAYDVLSEEHVSILVLMEVLREDYSTSSIESTRSGFNPCFNGSVERGSCS